MKMDYILSDFAQKQGYAVESYEIVDSTNYIAQQKLTLVIMVIFGLLQRAITGKSKKRENMV